MTNKKIKIEDLGDFQLDPKISAKVDRMTAQADADVEEARVNFRWGKEQLDIVKQAAQLMGIPYQTMIKQITYQQCLSILRQFEEYQAHKEQLCSTNK